MKSLYAIWMNHQVIGYASLDAIERETLNRHDNAPVYYGIDPETMAHLYGHKEDGAYTSAALCMSMILSAEKGMTCVYRWMTDEMLSKIEYPELVRDNRGNPLCVDNAYVIVTCENEHHYYINVTADSVTAMCAETFEFIQHK